MLSRIETQISLEWSKNNPAAFVAALLDFREKYKGKDWNVVMTFRRPGLIVLSAERVMQNGSA